MRRFLRSLLVRLPDGVKRAAKAIPGVDRLRSMLMPKPGGSPPLPGELRPIVYLPTWARWDEMRQRPQYLLAALASAGHDVWFVDPRESAERRVDGITIVPDLAPVPRSGVILYVHFPRLAPMVDLFDDPVLVYDVLDDVAIYDEQEAHLPVRRRIGPLHDTMVARADVVLASSRVLLDRHQTVRPDVILVENGVDAGRFAGAEPAVDLPEGRPLIGYHGAVASWFDFDLVTAVAASRPGMTFVIVGPVEDAVTARAHELGSLPNVHLIGPRPSGVIARYVAGVDVGIVPFRVTPMTEGVSPLKMFESLAAGKPVVATPLPACRGVAGVTVAADPERFAAAIDTALESARDPQEEQRRREAGGAADWSQRIEPLLARLDAVGARRVP